MRSFKLFILVSLAIFVLMSSSRQVNAELVTITQFSDIADKVRSNPNSLSAIMVTRLNQCERCNVGVKVFKEYAALVDGVVLTYLVDCEKVWENFEDQPRIPACDPEKKDQLPHITFFQPESDELDIYNKKNKKLPKDVPYQGMVSPDALMQKSKELLPSFIKTISNPKDIDNYLNFKEIPLKLVLFTDEEQPPLFLRALSGQYRGQVDFGLADVDNRKLKKRYNVSNFPLLIALKLSGTDYERADFSGEFTVPAVASFIQEQLKSMQVDKQNTKQNQGTYFDIPENVDVQELKPGQILAALKKYKENFVAFHLQKGKSSETAQIFDQLKQDFGNMFKYYQVQCNAECNEIFGSSLSTYPAVIIYPLSGTRNQQQFVKVNKYDDKNDLSSEILNSVLYSNLVESEVENDQDARKKIREGLDGKKYSVILAHDKYDHYQKLIFFIVTQQQRFRKYLNFVRYVNPTQSEIKNWSLNGVPGIVAVLELNDFQNTFRRSPYEQKDFQFKSVVDYLNQIAIQKQDEVVDQIKVEEIKKQEELEEKCLLNTEKPCLIALFDMSKEGKFKLDLEKINKIKKLYADRDIGYFYIDAKCHRELLQYFKIHDTNLNSLVYLDQKKTKYRLLKEAFELENLISFMDDLQGKKPKGLVALPGSIDLDERDCDAFNASEKQRLEQERLQKSKSKYKKDEL
ncbi:thioredoxin domain protein, putative (macronuclear) [Tetrahymena thermophila SB210]|uniref:Thioredoxin domain protein, putative n=1 Tax=Tetrahymena thermophila (strain SB210) TaxID=312017 RepID=Q22N27_TETTS|nr:thioredoxin domain protein, putative [Tetrahymena thermophila SB210]EAR86330.1 thioredoxin domain protein, putative [Tetrahymena thermophila SB210]|eukprot:XP_976843.1 thioredoxin domain protein, putative [Tetrahymena thermophila SB210]